MHSGSSEDNVWAADSCASCHMTHDRTRIYNVSPPPPGRETITIGDRRRINVAYIGNMDVIFHGKSDQRITLIDVAYVPGLEFNLYSLHAVQTTHLIVSNASGTHKIGENLTPRDTYVPMPKSVPVAAPPPAPAAAPLAPAPASTTPPASVLKPTAPITPRVGCDIKIEGNVEMPGRTRGETRAMRDTLQEHAHRHGILSTMEHAALVSMLATRE